MNKADKNTEAPRIFTSLEEAQKSKPQNKPKWVLWTITDPSGKVQYTWSDTSVTARSRVAKADGYTATGQGKPVSKDRVASMLAAMSAEDRGALLATYTGGKKGK